MRLLQLALIVTSGLLAGCASTATVDDSRFHFADDAVAGTITIYDGTAAVLCYRYGDQLADGVAEDRTRSGYVHPLWGLDGEVLTDDFPADHPHHRGLSLMWPRMRVDGEACELWHIRRLRTHFERFLTQRATAVGAELVIANRWVLDGERRVAREVVRLFVHPVEGPSRTIDVSFHLEAADLEIELCGAETKGYGGLFLRFAPRADTVITTDAGVAAADSDLARHDWADLTARFAGRAMPSGISVIPAVSHPDHPPPWTLRHYGGLGVAWPGVEPFTLRPRDALDLDYRIVIHRGVVMR